MSSKVGIYLGQDSKYQGNSRRESENSFRVMLEEFKIVFEWSLWDLEAVENSGGQAPRGSEVMRDNPRLAADEFEHRTKCPAR